MPKKDIPEIRKRSAPPPAEIVSLNGLNLQFGRRKPLSPYRVLLERLLEADKNSVLKINNVKARYSIIRQARELGWNVAFAEHEGYLYAKIDGVADKKGSAPVGIPKTASATHVLNALASGPMTAVEIGRMLGADAATCEAVLVDLTRRGALECDRDTGKRAIYRRRNGAD